MLPSETIENVVKTDQVLWKRKRKTRHYYAWMYVSDYKQYVNWINLNKCIQLPSYCQCCVVGFFCKDLFFNLELTNNSNCKDPQEESVQHHGYIFPIFLHFVRILRPPGAINLMGTFDIVKNTLYYLVISAIYLTPSTARISSGQICPSAPWGWTRLTIKHFPSFILLSPQICWPRPSAD